MTKYFTKFDSLDLPSGSFFKKYIYCIFFPKTIRMTFLFITKHGHDHKFALMPLLLIKRSALSFQGVSKCHSLFALHYNT